MYKVTVCKFENSKEPEHVQELLISASHPRIALAKALRIVRSLGKWSGQEGNLHLVYERLTEREVGKFAATQAMQKIAGLD